MAERCITFMAILADDNGRLSLVTVTTIALRLTAVSDWADKTLQNEVVSRRSESFANIMQINLVQILLWCEWDYVIVICTYVGLVMEGRLYF
jgi:hypothetical protein